MYKNIFVAIDNSYHSNVCIELSVLISKKFDSIVTGCHVFDASLHQKRFRDMEKGLPPQYQEEKELQRQRDLHTTLINKGLEMISESYLDVFKARCHEASVQHNEILLQGKNYYEIIRELSRGGYDLAIMGALGLAAVDEHLIGSVCERVVRRIKTDVLVVKNKRFNGKILVAVDGSKQSFAGLQSAIALAKSFDMKLCAISVFDPHYHRVAFESIAKVLSEDAGEIFRFKEQETLHEEIIDKGLAKIYQNHLDCAEKMVEASGLGIETVLLDGKPYDQILKYVRKEKPSLLVIGRTGIHNTNGLDLGSATENLLRLAPCNVLLTGGNAGAGLVTHDAYSGSKKSSVNQNLNSHGNNKQYENGKRKNTVLDSTRTASKVCSGKNNDLLISWTREAETQTNRIPSFVRTVVKKKIEDYAREKGFQEVTTEIVDEVKKQMMGNDTSHIT
ncbi:MAG: universal stress protein [Candidatus Brocadiaceae bacterium]|nr:universal stress protein [Candidatus Brocadiaceae bacterium]